MPRKKADKVVAIGDKREAELTRRATLHCEALAKDDPSDEARAYYDAQLNADPDEWRKYGDLARAAFDLAFKGFWLGYVTKESVRRGAELLRAELGYAEAQPAERILIDHAVLCHVRLGMVEHLYSRQTSGSYSMAVGEHWERRLALAQRRFTRAVLTLERVRVLLARAEASRRAASAASTRAALSVLKATG